MPTNKKNAGHCSWVRSDLLTVCRDYNKATFQTEFLSVLYLPKQVSSSKIMYY